MADDTLTKLVNWYEEWETSTASARALSERDRDYYDSKQLTSAEEATLKKRGQPVVVVNRTKPKVDYLLGTERQTRTDPRAAPRTPMDEDAAHAATDSIRFVCDSANFPKISSDVFENETIEGAGGAIGEWDGKKIQIKRVPWDRLFWDPHSRERDFSDAKYTGIVVWMDRDDAEQLYPGKESVLEAGFASTASDTHDDKPTLWTDSKRKRVKICQIYYKDGGVEHVATYTKAGFLRDPKVSEYVNEDGEPICNLKMVSCHVDRQNNRYGIVRQLISIQDEINKRRSKALHLISVRQVRSERGAVDDVSAAKRELAKPDGWVETNPGFEFEVLQTGDMAAAQFQLLQEAKSEIDTVGAAAALSGKDEDSQSGRALQARQQGGMLELGPVFDAHKMWRKQVYELIWCMVKQFWTAETWVRVTDDENNIKFVGLNQPQIDPMTGQPAVDPQTGQPVLQNDVSRMNVDIILEEVPDTVNIQSEQFELMVKVFQADKKGEMSVRDVIELSSLRNKKQILERMSGESDPAAAQVQQEAQQMQKAGAMAEIEKTQSEKEKNLATAEKTRVETEILGVQTVHNIAKDQAQTAMSADKQAFDMTRGDRDDQFRARDQNMAAEQQAFTQSQPPKAA